MEMCDICGQPLPADEAVRGEMMTSELMCPTHMTMHQDCFEKASVMWAPEVDECPYDSRYPETAAWSANPGDEVAAERVNAEFNLDR
ncbi:MAG: hypothetical protein ACRDZ8_21810 [Acidimicrobiales bacterium]